MRQEWNALEHDITTALERGPEVRVPDDFAARLTAQAAVLSPYRTRRAVNYGKMTTIVCALALLVIMFLMAPRTQPDIRNFGFDIELLLLAQLVAIGWWLAGRRSA